MFITFNMVSCRLVSRSCSVNTCNSNDNNNWTVLWLSLGSVVADHRRRIKTDEKAKVVAAVWGEEFIKFLAAVLL